MIWTKQWEWPVTIAQEGDVNTSDNARMKLGIILPEAEGDFAGGTAGWRDFKEMAQLAEQIGLDSVWFVDHLLYRNPKVAPPRPSGSSWVPW